MDVAMYCIPPSWLVIEVVDGDAAAGCGAEFADEEFDPVAGPGGVDRGAGVSGLVAGDIAAAGIRAAIYAVGIEASAAATTSLTAEPATE